MPSGQPFRENPQVIHLHPADNICVATRPLAEGDVVEVAGTQVRLLVDVPLGHKLAVTAVAAGGQVSKYGQPIGVATEAIAPGQWVHSHNLANGEFARDYAFATEVPPPPPPLTDRSFLGYRRPTGRVGTRNYIAVISTVNCSASVCKYVAQRFPQAELQQRFPNVDGVISFTHEGGCGIHLGSLKHQMLNRVLGGIATHPNIAAYLLIGLGCEQASPGFLIQQQNLVQIEGTGNPQGPLVLSMQDCGGTAKTVAAAAAKVEELLPRVNAMQRETVPASELILATECGGSDGNSGITANPAVGAAADLLVACGGTSILAETTEIYGAEHLLTRRAVSAEVGQKLLDRIEWWKWYANLFGAELDNNPTVGNKLGGLTTIAEKSLGAVAKGGTTALIDVYQYAEPVQAKGFVIMDTPGYDPPSVTGMVAGGANIAVFTTGRGSCFGCKPTPCLKVASNTPMYERMRDDMDLNAGEILHGRTVADVGAELFQQILDVASGKPTKSEAQGIGDEEFVPWTVGAIL